jgi:hypothetical protein
MTKLTYRKRMLATYRDSTDIVAPLIPGGLMPDSPTRVTVESPLVLRKAVYQCARWFKKEFQYDYTQYGYNGREDDPNHVAFLWPHPDSILLLGNDEFVLAIIGACCFRWRNDYWNQDHCWAMQWMWLHPFYRHRGLLSQAWGGFRGEFGSFVAEPPLSDAMEGFLGKQGECWLCGKSCTCSDRPAKRSKSVRKEKEKVCQR